MRGPRRGSPTWRHTRPRTAEYLLGLKSSSEKVSVTAWPAGRGAEAGAQRAAWAEVGGACGPGRAGAAKAEPLRAAAVPVVVRDRDRQLLLRTAGREDQQTALRRLFDRRLDDVVPAGRVVAWGVVLVLGGGGVVQHAVVRVHLAAHVAAAHEGQREAVALREQVVARHALSELHVRRGIDINDLRPGQRAAAELAADGRAELDGEKLDAVALAVVGVVEEASERHVEKRDACGDSDGSAAGAGRWWW